MMNSNRSSNAWKKLQDKGYYIVLTLCILAIGISGYIFVSTAIRQTSKPDETLSVPVTVDKLPEGSQPGATTPTAGPADEEEPPLVPVTPTKPTQPTVPVPSAPSQAEKDEQLRQEAKKLAVPPLQGEVIQTFSMDTLSYNETTRDWRLHDAVDIAAQGQVRAVMAGTVTEIFEDDALGATVVITHDGGYETRYSNLAADMAVTVGAQVSPGDIIGAVGDTALLESGSVPHLHFQVLLNGEPTDPTEFLE